MFIVWCPLSFFTFCDTNHTGKQRPLNVPKAILEWQASEPEGWFGLGPAEQKIKLQELAQYLYELIIIFEKELAESEPYQLLKRLFSEQCEFGTDQQSSKVQVKKKSEGASLQSPYGRRGGRS